MNTQIKHDNFGHMEEETHPTIAKFNILKWWSVNGSRFPTISKIARDVIAVPATTFALNQPLPLVGE